jgi:GT2 family glycosyltransferase
MGETIGNRFPLTSIIVPCCNQLEFTRRCVAALMRCTRPPWELIAINNGSNDGAADYLAGVQDASRVPVAVIANSRNLGFPAAINQGLAHARGENLVLLNNDAVVTDGWLEQLIALTRVPMRGETSTPSDLAAGAVGSAEPALPSGSAFEAPGGAASTPLPPAASRHLVAPRPPPLAPPSQGGESAHYGPLVRGIGLVGPMTNYAPPPQLVEQVPYRDLDEMHAFARRWRGEHLGQWFMVPKLSGFCLLMKREVYEGIGGLDERFGLGLFDDDDLAMRARQAGFELAVAHDLFVHHFGGRTFVGNGVDAARLLDENEQRFAAKWGSHAPRGQRVALRPFAANGARTSREAAEARRDAGKLPREFGREPDRHEAGLAELDHQGTELGDRHVLSAAPREICPGTVRALQSGRDRHRAARLAAGARLSPPQSGGLGADRFDHAHALCPDRTSSSDARRTRAGPGDLRRGPGGRPRGRRVTFPRSRHPAPEW